MNRKLAFLALIIFIWTTQSCVSQQIITNSAYSTINSGVNINDNLSEEAASAEESAAAEESTADTYTADPVIIQPGRAELVMRALHEAFPDRIRSVEFRNDDWAVLLRISAAQEVWYYYAQSRMLTEEQLPDIANFRAHQFYNYPDELPVWVARTPEESERIRQNRANDRVADQLSRSNFMNDLWGTTTRRETEDKLVNITFFGRQGRVHREIAENLRRVDQQVRALGRTDRQVQAFIDSIHTMETYNWRVIAQTMSRSFHSLGLAVDILPRTLGGLQVYWLWTADRREDWWNVPYSQRWHPPPSVIRIFEANGFVWGGKWFLFDTMHFEYRPEVMILNRNSHFLNARQQN